MEASKGLVTGNSNKKIGIGSVSLLLFACGLLFSLSFGAYGSIGDSVLRLIGLAPWSNGDTGLHYTLIYSLVFFIPALIIGYKFRDDFGAKLGENLSLFAVVFLVVLFVFFII